jgi:anti-sigma factor ChrR (cupin superfamily)
MTASRPPAQSGAANDPHSAPAGDDALLQRVRARVMKAIAAESVAHREVVPAGWHAWRPFLPGIERQVLHESGGIMCYLLKFAPGAVLPAHRHPVDEECVVLEGSVKIGSLELAAGSFKKVRSTMLDADTSSDGGAVIYLRGAPPQLEHML